MKKILGLDLGTTSIGWALVNEATEKDESSSIIKLGVRVNPLTVDEKTDFEKGRPLSTNADRTLKRAARRNLQRYKLRRKNLIDVLLKNKIIDVNTQLTEIGKNTTHQTLSLRALAATDKISLHDFAKVLLTINKKRGYKSSRKAVQENDGVAIDGMDVAKKLYDENLTPGQFVLSLLNNDKKFIPDFYRSDLLAEFKKIWNYQKKYYKEILEDSLFTELQGKNKNATWAICEKPFNLVGIKRTGNSSQKKLENYQWRALALSERLDLEQLVIVLQEINGELNNSSDYLGKISDRSKELYFKNKTVGQYLYSQLLINPHTSLKNQVFYRQDYLDEFEKIWVTQAKHHSILSPQLKEEIRDIIIFYQRKLKSQKGLLSFCQFESWKQDYIDTETGKTKQRTIGRKVIPKSSPLFQQAKIWQNLNNLEYHNEKEGKSLLVKELDEDVRQLLFQELNLRGNLSATALLKTISNFIELGKTRNWKSNYDKTKDRAAIPIEGNLTNSKIFNVLQSISVNEGYGIDWNKASASEILEELENTLPLIGIDKSILKFDADIENWDKQTSYQLWHLLYATEEDEKVTESDRLIYGNSSVNLKKALHTKFGFKPEYAKLMANVVFPTDHGNLSAKALRKIMPFLEAGHIYPDACSEAGYNHSNSLTKEQLANRELKPHLDLVKKNSLRNPVVEKILNQMVNVVNQVIETYGKPDEIRIELARELKKSAKERADMTKGIADATKRNEDLKKHITKTFGIPNPTKNDVIRYRLFLELEKNGFKDIFRNQPIKHEDLFSKKIDIEHIIPKALTYDDSFSNKTLAFREDNLKKADRTAIDFITNEYASSIDDYSQRVEMLYKAGAISKAKQIKLLRTQKDVPDGFIERDLRNSQYIAKKAKEMLFEVFEKVLSTSGSVTDRLRKDWDLINVMKELNLPKYKALGLTEFEERLDLGTGKIKKYEVIKDWSKRNDHRHHAMDALTVAFTTHNHVQYINNFNARRNEKSDFHPVIKNIEKKITKVNDNNKRVFIKPLPRFRESAKKHIEEILISFKNKNKVVTWNVNTTKGKDGIINKKRQQTPRGQLHKETIYGKSKRVLDKKTKLTKKFTLENAELIVNTEIKKIVLKHLELHHNKPEVAFDSKTLKNQPLMYKDEAIKEVQCFEEIYTIRKDVNPDNFKNEKLLEKVVDGNIRSLLIKRFKDCGGDAKKAFSDLDKNPIWLHKEKQIAIKRVTITGVKNAYSIHTASDHLGNEIKDVQGDLTPIDYVESGNNHHVAIYHDLENDSLKEDVVPFFIAVTRKINDQPIIKTINNEGFPLLFTLKQNEMFVFPKEDFNPSEIDLLDSENYSLISPNLFRVQSISSKYYIFRHHLETTAASGDDFKNRKNLASIAYRFHQNEKYLKGAIKVRLNHLGQIVQIGEY
ncbi:MAG: type II CRISPR RNA-guided endonuclease Cas9 [Nonlabens sp.]|uniref:type II CRISPR RNA-guided endonuclease Cas9 n=1 Tax=Nonlabens sp. TaxID=1888209 RepID=UPI00321AFE74